MELKNQPAPPPAPPPAPESTRDQSAWDILGDYLDRNSHVVRSEQLSDIVKLIEQGIAEGKRQAQANEQTLRRQIADIRAQLDRG